MVYLLNRVSFSKLKEIKGAGEGVRVAPEN